MAVVLRFEAVFSIFALFVPSACLPLGGSIVASFYRQRSGVGAVVRRPGTPAAAAVAGPGSCLLRFTRVWAGGRLRGARTAGGSPGPANLVKSMNLPFCLGSSFPPAVLPKASSGIGWLLTNLPCPCARF